MIHTDASRISELTDILREALSDMEGMHAPTCAAQDNISLLEDGTFEAQASSEECDCWMVRAKDALEPKIAQPISTEETCGLCSHQVKFHAAGGRGLCTKVDCECMKFQPKVR